MSDKIQTSLVDNGFEKVDTLANEAEEPSSTTVEDVKPQTPVKVEPDTSEAEPAPTGNLLDFDVPSPPPPQPSAPEAETVLPDSVSAPADLAESTTGNINVLNIL